jgi:HEAT repeat protein
VSTLVALALAVPVAAQQVGKTKTGEPTFDGQPLSAIIADLGAQAPLTRVSAAYACAALGPSAKAAVPALLKNLEDENNAVRYSSALALGDIGPDASPAVETLRKLLDDRSDDVAHIARKSLKKITGEAVPLPD